MGSFGFGVDITCFDSVETDQEAEKKNSPVQHGDDMHLPGEEKDRGDFYPKQCSGSTSGIESSTAHAKVSLKILLSQFSMALGSPLVV